MAFKIKDGVRIGTTDVFNNSGTLLVNAPTATKLNAAVTIALGTGATGTATSFDGSGNITIPVTALGAGYLSGTIPSTVLGNSTVYIGTTAVTLNRASGALSLTGTSIDGNAGTVTNGVYTTGSYADPSWITSLAKSKVGLSNVENTALSTWAGSTNITTIGAATATSLVVSGNLTVNGTTTTVNSTVTTIDDPVITLGGDTAPASDDGKDRGVEFRWHNGTVAKIGFFGFDDSTGKFTFIPDATNASEVFSGTKGTIDANIEWADILNKPSFPDTNTTYSISAETTTGGANIRLSGSDATTDDLKIAAGSNVTVTRTDANTITISATDTNTTYSKATSTTLGLVELFDNTVQTVAANAVTTTASRTYGIQLNAADQMVVNVPWTDTTYAKANTTTLGLVKLVDATVQSTAANAVTTTASRSYAVQFNGSDQLVVNVPWTDTNTDTLQTTANDTTNADRYVDFVNSASGAQTAGTSTGLLYNPSTGSLRTQEQRLAINTTDKIFRKAISVTDNINTEFAVDSWAIATYRSAKYIIQITQGSKYYFSELHITHDGSVAYLTEYAVLENGTIAWDPATSGWTASIATGTLTLQAKITNAATTNAVFLIERTLFAV